MRLLIKNPQDFWSGIIFLIFGSGAILIGRDYAMGTAGQMGPAYFPTAIGALLLLVGALALLRSTIRSGPAIGRFSMKQAALVLSAPILFGLLLHVGGFLVAIFLLVLISGCASTRFRTVPYLALALGFALFCVLLFVVLLGIPLPIFGTLFNF